MAESLCCIFETDSIINQLYFNMGFPGGPEVKASACNAGDLGSIPGSGISPGEGNGNPLQYSCLENPMDGGAWWATVHRVAKSRTRLSDFTYLLTYDIEEILRLCGSRPGTCGEEISFSLSRYSRSPSHLPLNGNLGGCFWLEWPFKVI